MDEAIAEQLELYRSRLARLVGRGLELGDALASDPSSVSALADARRWQQDCGVTVNELSGGSKAHWLARAFSEAFLVRASAGGATEDVPPSEIVKRLIEVLEQALASLSQADARERILSPQSPAPHQFDFVRDPELRPVLEQAYLDGRAALEAGAYDLALRTHCGMIEALVTDALRCRGLSALHAEGASGTDIAAWPFTSRLAVAEESGLIGRGCARLPEVARRYREMDGPSHAPISERDARVTGQVLHVIMRDLNPGR